MNADMLTFHIYLLLITSHRYGFDGLLSSKKKKKKKKKKKYS